MTTSYEIQSYFAAGKTRYWAEYVDKKENGGNNDGYVNGKEIQLFKDIFKHRYNGFEYDFNLKDSDQAGSLLDDKYQKGETCIIAEQFYHSSNLLKQKGSDFIGYAISNQLGGPTLDYNSIKIFANKLNTFPVEAKKYQVIKDFLTSYSLGEARNGFFEQLGSEWGKGITNGDAVKIMEAIITSIPEDKKYTDDFGTINRIYTEYKNKPADEKFKDSTWSFISSMFSKNTLDQLDDSVERLFGI